MDISSNVVNSSISLYLFMSMLHVKKRLDEIDCFNIHIKKKGGGEAYNDNNQRNGNK